MHILHVYEVGTALNNKETVLDQEHHSTAPKKTQKSTILEVTLLFEIFARSNTECNRSEEKFPKYLFAQFFHF